MCCLNSAHFKRRRDDLGEQSRLKDPTNHYSRGLTQHYRIHPLYYATLVLMFFFVKGYLQLAE